jgi:hypothetical protein
MPRRCPPGVLCMENVTIMFICVIIIILGCGIYLYNKQATRVQATQVHYRQEPIKNNIMFMPNNSSKGRGDDVFFDIYQPPLRNDRCMTGGGDIRGSIPINVSTQRCDDAPYRQLGILTRYGGKDETILPLMGRPLFSNRDKWNFYTLNDKNNMIKLPVKVKGKSGTSEYGCDNVYNGDIVFVEGYNDAFKVTTYDNDIVRYLPSL